MEPVDAAKNLRVCCNTSESRFDIAKGTVHVSQAEGDLPSNSPFGSWMNMYFPVGKRLGLRQQY